MKKLKITSIIYKMRSHEFAMNDDQSCKVPFRGFRGNKKQKSTTLKVPGIYPAEGGRGLGMTWGFKL
jgi:hypothetical protein